MPQNPEPVDLAKARRERYASLRPREAGRARAEADEERERVAWQRRSELALIEGEAPQARRRRT